MNRSANWERSSIKWDRNNQCGIRISNKKWVLPEDFKYWNWESAALEQFAADVASAAVRQFINSSDTCLFRVGYIFFTSLNMFEGEISISELIKDLVDSGDLDDEPENVEKWASFLEKQAKILRNALKKAKPLSEQQGTDR